MMLWSCLTGARGGLKGNTITQREKGQVKVENLENGRCVHSVSQYSKVISKYWAPML